MGEIKNMMKWKKRVDKEMKNRRRKMTHREKKIYGRQNVRGVVGDLGK